MSTGYQIDYGMIVNVLSCEKGIVIMQKNNLIPRSFMMDILGEKCLMPAIYFAVIQWKQRREKEHADTLGVNSLEGLG